MHYTPIYVPNSVTVDRIGGIVSAFGVTGNARFGIYTDSTGKPGSLVVDGGTVSATSATSFTVTVSQALTPGWYWIAFVQHTGSSSWVSTVAGGGAGSLHSLPLTSATDITTRSGYTQSSVTGALPSTATPVASSSALVIAYIRIV